ncbi:unnamed protein product [Heterobilharzia americana]|nr:unnamed protein product [Heterobilharzia americana]
MLLEIFTLVLGIPFKLALECYVCTNVEGNWNECIRTVQTCDPSQDTCQSIVQYRNQKRETGYVLIAAIPIGAITTCLELPHDHLLFMVVYTVHYLPMERNMEIRMTKENMKDKQFL